MKKKEAKKRKYEFPTNLTMVFVNNPSFHDYHEIGKNLFCLFQLYSRVPGIRAVARKSELAQTMRKYTEYFAAEKPAKC